MTNNEESKVKLEIDDEESKVKLEIDNEESKVKLEIDDENEALDPELQLWVDLNQQFITLSRQYNNLFVKTQTFTPDSTQKMENMVQQINNLAEQIVKLSQELKI